MAPSALVKGRRVEVSRVCQKEDWAAVLRRPATTKASPVTVPGIDSCGLSAVQLRSGARIAGVRPAHDFPRGVLSRAEMDSRKGQLREMGFSEQAALDALCEVSWNLNAALDLLFTRGSPMAAPASTDIACCDVSCSVANVNADDDTLSTLSVESGSQPDTESDMTAAQSPRAQDSSSSVSSQHGGSIQGSPSLFACPHVEPCLPQQPVALPTPEIVSQDITSSCTEVVEGIAAVTLVAGADSNQPLRRLKEAWTETDSSQLGLQAGGLVRLWLGTETELGWVYVEEVGGAGRAGWMPAHVLETVQDGHTAVRAIHPCEARFENQLSVQEGSMFLVDIHSRTDDGWAYAETIESPEGAKGWVPIMCLEWPEL